MAKDIDSIVRGTYDPGEALTGLLDLATPSSARRALGREVVFLGEEGETPLLDNVVVSARLLA